MAIFEQSGIVRWVETDASGHFHNSSAIIWAEEAEHALYRQAAPEFDLSRIPRRAIQMSFNRPLFAGDAYLVKLWVDRIGDSSMSFGWHIMLGEDIAIEGSHSLVYVGTDGRPVSLPDHVCIAMSEFLSS
jgi:acyl-CoA thioester hydrolase